MIFRTLFAAAALAFAAPAALAQATPATAISRFIELANAGQLTTQEGRALLTGEASEMATDAKSNLPAADLSERSRMLMTYALCGFANIASVGITVTGFSILMPERRAEVMGMVWKALIAGFLATCMTAAVVGCMPPWIFGQ